jgi:inhibitor of KinA
MWIEHIKYNPCGDRAVLLEFGEKIDLETNLKVRRAFHIIHNDRNPAIVEAVPAMRSLLVYYDARSVDYHKIVAYLDRTIRESDFSEKPNKRVVIPVLYGDEFGPDLPYVSDYHAISEDDVVRLHSEAVYVNGMYGFDPGFVVLIGLPENLETPRKDSPRLKVPAGSVGIGAAQTGVYAFERAGGWQIIGRTPIKMVNFAEDVELMADLGDEIVFEPISRERYDAILRSSGNHNDRS